MRLLSAKKFRRYRIKKCRVCKKPADTLGKEFDIVGFIRPTLHNKKKAYEWSGAIVHKKCGKKMVTPEGWQRFNQK